MTIHEPSQRPSKFVPSTKDKEIRLLLLLVFSVAAIEVIGFVSLALILMICFSNCGGSYGSKNPWVIFGQVFSLILTVNPVFPCGIGLGVGVGLTVGEISIPVGGLTIGLKEEGDGWGLFLPRKYIYPKADAPRAIISKNIQRKSLFRKIFLRMYFSLLTPPLLLV